MIAEITAFFFSPRRAYLFLILAGIVSVLGFPPMNQWMAFVLSLAFLIRFLLTSATLKQKMIGGFFFGFAQGAVSMSWLINALMIDSGQFILLAPLVPLGMGLLFGIFFAFPAGISTYARSPFKKILAFATGMSLFEWIRSWFLTGFPWNLSGSVFMEQEALLQSASVFGIYGLTFLACLIAGGIALLPRIKPLIYITLFIAMIEFIGAVRLWSANPTNVWGVTLRLVQPNIPQTLKWDPTKSEEHFNRLIRLSKENNTSVTHVIWPESAVDFAVNVNHGERIRTMSALRQGSSLILGGMNLKQTRPPKIANSIFVLNDLGDITAVYDKSHLVPFGEYVPLGNFLPIRKIVPIGPDFVRGTGPRTIQIDKAPPAGMTVCYEIIFSGQVTDPNNRPAWLINVTNDAWYGQSAGPYQHFAMARLRAVEEGVPVVRSANSGISAVIDPYGRVPHYLDLGKSGILDAPLPNAIPATLYAQTGPWLFMGICFVLLLFSLKKQK